MKSRNIVLLDFRKNDRLIEFIRKDVLYDEEFNVCMQYSVGIESHG